MNIGFTSYVTAAILFAVFTLLLMTCWRGRLEGRLLVAASGISTLWAIYSAYIVSSEQVVVNHYLYHSFEAARNISWYLFLYALLKPLKELKNVTVQRYRKLMNKTYWSRTRPRLEPVERLVQSGDKSIICLSLFFPAL